MINKPIDSINVLDCTFRDGGYYNNWEFNLKTIKNYLKFIKQVNINHVEIGFFTIKKNNNLGITANINKSFFKKIKIPKEINIGIMINASELVNYQNFSDLKKRLKDIDYKKINFIRIACHLSEIYKIKKYLIFFKKKKVKIFLNLMQASEINLSHILYISKNLSLYIDHFYFADSFGSLNENSTKKLSHMILKNLNISLGIHAHNNLKLALKNSLCSIKQGATWVDGTIYGMGRGPGNTKVEDLITNILKNKKFKKFKSFNILKRDFDKLLNKYKWGSNKFYNYSGKNKIHPTYVQMILSDKRIKKNNYLSILKNIAKHKSKKFDPNELYSATVFYKKKFNKFKIINRNFLNNYNNFVIINSQIKENKFNSKVEKYLKDKNCLKILVNKTQNKRLEKLSDINSICHPLRLMSINKFTASSFKKVLLPKSNLSQPNDINILKSKVIDFPIIIKNNITINKNYVSLPEPLSLIYTICFLISSSISDIKLVGFEGYKKFDPFQDKTQEFFSILIKKYNGLKISSLTKTNFKFN